MCLYPKKIKNKKYIANDKNGGDIPSPPVIGYNDLGLEIYDERVLEIEVPCGQCIECRKAKAREWQVRLAEELKTWKYAYFVTLTFSPEELEQICKKKRLKECNAVAGYAVRHMLERWRKDHKKTLRHWLVSELGHEGTERIHMHGLIFNNEPLEFGKSDENNMRIWKYWKYGHIFVGDYCTQKTINYIVKYINKIDEDHKGFVGQIFASPGIGSNWLNRIECKKNIYRYRPKNNIDYYVLNNGSKIKLPKYYKNKIYNEQEREMIWREFMDLNQETIAGNTYSKKETSQRVLSNITETARIKNIEFGYGDDSQEWRKKDYNITRRMLVQEEKQKRIEEMQKAILKKLEEDGALSPEMAEKAV